MAVFDLDTFLRLQGQGQGLVGSLGTSFGFPSCLLNLTSELMYLLPSSVLVTLNEDVGAARENANKEQTRIWNKITFNTGIVFFDTDTGFVRFGSNSNRYLGENTGELGGLEGFLGLVTSGLAGAGQIYTNLESARSQYEFYEGCVRGYVNLKKSTGGRSANERAKLSEQEYNALLETKYAAEIGQLTAVRNADSALANVQELIQNTLAERIANPELEPKVSPQFASLVSGTDFRISDEEEDQASEIIRLVYGPPQSSKGRYLLSTDGLYYNSQTDEGLEPVLLFVSDSREAIEQAKKWRFNYSPNVGGKGDQISSKTFNKWINTVFDPNIINDGLNLKEFYDRDHFLRVLEGQKEKRILDIDKQIEELQNSGASESIVENFKQSLLSEVAYHNNKINRRKKQIEVAVLAPSIFNKGVSPAPGMVPINDFSYLQDCNISLALDTQRKLILDQEEVSGVVLPLRPTFVQSRSVDAVESIEHLMVPEVGLGAIITDDRNPSDSSSVELSISDVIISDRLIGVYNFLNSKTTVPSSLEFDVLNCMTSDDYNNAQLVAPDAEFVFGKSDKATLGIGYGLGAAYLEGITKNYGVNPSALGSYVKLPDTPEYQDWLYNKSGATFDTWVYAPYLTFDESWDNDLSTSALYRLILACENTGVLPSVVRDSSEDIFNVGYSDGSEFTKGLILGFTRDIRWRGQYAPTNDGSIQKGEDGGFILAPTISYDISSVAFISKARAQNTCVETSGWLGMYVPLSATTNSGKRLESCSRGFCQLSVTFDYAENAVSLYLDSELLATSAVSEVFGTQPTHSIKLPTFKKVNSFEYSEGTVGLLAPRSLKAGPKLNSYFTPWILGGGYTDGMANSGNFMGGEYGGVRSGLRGYLGSTKFYSKPLTQKELNFNYSVQSKLYKNLDAENNEYDVVIALGQSNMDGSLVLATDVNIPAQYREEQFNTKIWMPNNLTASAGEWRNLNAFNISDQNFGGFNSTRYYRLAEPDRRFTYESERHYDPVMEFASNYVEDQQRDIYLVKNAKGATAMVSGLDALVNFNSWTDDGAAGAQIQGYGLYYTLKNDLVEALTSLSGAPYTKVRVKAILMMQGEFEAYSTTSLPEYPNPGDMAAQWANYFSGTLYPRLQNDIREILGTPNAPDVPWIFTQVQEEMYQPTTRAFVQDVRDQQQSVDAREDLEAYMVNVDGLSFTDGTNVHFDALGLTQVGRKLYDKYKEITE